MGFPIKNKPDYPTDEEVSLLLEMCEVLRLRPVLVARMASGKVVKRIATAGGFSILYKRWLLRPSTPWDKFYQISAAGKDTSLLRLPVSIYRYPPEMLLR